MQRLPIFLLCLSVSCSDTTPTEPSPLANTVFLLDELAQSELAWTHPQAAPNTAPAWLEQEFQRGSPRIWHEGREIAHLVTQRTPPSLVSEFRQDGGRSFLRVPPSAAGLFLELPTPAPTALEVTVISRVAATTESDATLQVEALAEPPTDLRQTHQLAPILVERALTARPTKWSTSLTAGDWKETTLRFFTHPRQQGLRLSIRSSQTPVDLAHLRVQPLTQLQWITGLDHQIETLTAADCRQKLRIGEELVDCLVLPVGAAMTIPVTPSLPATSLTFRAGAVVRNDEEATLRIEWSGPSREVSPPQSSDLSMLPLQRFQISANHVDQITLRCQGAGDGFVVLAHPRLLGERRHSGPHVILLSIDTLRPDFLPSYGFPGDLTPTLSQLARSGAVLTNAYSPSCYTLPAHATMLTGQHPLEHGLFHPKYRLSLAQSTPLAQVFRNSGYLTKAFTGGVFLNPDFGFHHGFDSYLTSEVAVIRERFEQRSTNTLVAEQRESVQQVLDWLQLVHEQSFFLFLHTYFVHNYVVADEYLERTREYFPAHDCTASAAELWDIVETTGAGSTEHLRHLYAASILQLDEVLLQPLVAELQQLDLLEETLLVITSDHGEEFLEHGAIGHGHTLFDELVHIPMILTGPGVAQGTRFSHLTGLQDLYPTVLDLAQLEPRSWVGHNMLQTAGEEPVLLYHRNDDVNSHWQGVLHSGWKFLSSDLDSELTEYLFRMDDRDATNLATQFPPVAAQLAKTLQQAQGQLTERQDLAGENLSEELKERLRALGYVDLAK